jgi:hypothetical protein
MSEADALLGKKKWEEDSVISLREVWQRGSALWLLVGACVSVAAGVANGYTCVLYGRVLDAMARATLVGVDAILSTYLRLAAVELLATWVQYGAWTHTARLVAAKSTEDPNATKTFAYVEALGAVCFNIGVGVTAAVISLQYGWDSLLVVVVAGLGLALSSFVMIKCLARCFLRGKRLENGDVETPEKKAHRIEHEIDQLWHHARSLRLLGATSTAVARVRRLMDERGQRQSIIGMMVVTMEMLCFPIVVAIVYTAWKVDSDASPRHTSAVVDVAVVVTASSRAVAACQSAWTTFQKGDLSLKSLEGAESPSDSAPMDPKRRADAAAWIRALAAPYVQSTVVQVVFAGLTAGLYVVTAVVVGYSAAWLLEAPFATSTSLPTAWKLAGGVVLCAAAIGVTWDLSIRGQVTPSRHVGLSIFLRVFATRLSIGGGGRSTATPVAIDSEMITAKRLVEDTTTIGMCVGNLVEPPYLTSATIGLASLVASLAIDPAFTAIMVLFLPFQSTEYLVRHRRDKSLYRSLASPCASWSSSGWPLVLLGESLLRAVLHTMASLTTIALAYIVMERVATGTSTVFSILSVEMVGMICFSVAHASRFTAGAFLQDKALRAAATLQEYIQQHASTDLDAQDDGNSMRGTRPLTGDLVLHANVGDPVRVNPGQQVDLSPPLGNHVVASIMDNRTVGFAAVGDDELSHLPRSVLLDRIMVINSDPVRLPGSILENIDISAGCAGVEAVEKAAREAGLSGDDLEKTVSSETWYGADAGMLKEKVLIARVLLRGPDVLLVEATPPEVVGPIDLATCIESIRAKLPHCRVVVLTEHSPDE